ncbi:hydroxyacid dehydrogenase [Roseixanthobacter glucoisosaccharinicivorans]|uniref:hydroxyacid dehydrogenase n=1 Tax=Roseixanthobacter glucoisosaccharinicivorans TaxID=3119923 RepID=UPI00372B7462
MPEILVTEFMDAAALDALRADHDVHYDPTLVDKADVLAQLAQGARALIVRNRTQVRAGLLANAPNLVVVGRLGVGLDNIDVADCRARSIEVYPATGANDVAVAEYVICGILVLLRGAYHASAEVAAGAWPRTRLMGREVSGKRLGLIGFGAIARETARRARALGMEVVAFDPFVAADDPAWRAEGVVPVSLEDLLGESDAVSLHVPMTAQTRNLIDAPALDRMKPGAVLINAARGGVVDEAALAAALKRGAIGGAMLDVFESEPLGAGSVLCDVPNLILTPHIAGVTEESNVRVSALIATKVSQFLKGRS